MIAVARSYCKGQYIAFGQVDAIEVETDAQKRFIVTALDGDCRGYIGVIPHVVVPQVGAGAEALVVEYGKSIGMGDVDVDVVGVVGGTADKDREVVVRFAFVAVEWRAVFIAAGKGHVNGCYSHIAAFGGQGGFEAHVVLVLFIFPVVVAGSGCNGDSACSEQGRYV